jgi:hypothetical protein
MWIERWHLIALLSMQDGRATDIFEEDDLDYCFTSSTMSKN